MTKELIILSLTALIIYLYYQQNNQPNLLTSNNQVQISQLQQEVQHYQTLYQKRVAKDLEADQSAQIKQLTLNNQQLESNLSGASEKNNLFQQKVESLETQLINLAKQKIKGKKEFQGLLGNLEKNWNQDKELWKTTETDYLNKLTEIKKDQSQKERTIIGLNNSYEKLDKKLEQEQKKTLESQKLLEDEKANYLKDISQKEQVIENLTQKTHNLKTYLSEQEGNIGELERMVW